MHRAAAYKIPANESDCGVLECTNDVPHGNIFKPEIEYENIMKVRVCGIRWPQCLMSFRIEFFMIGVMSQGTSPCVSRGTHAYGSFFQENFLKDMKTK